MKEFLTSLPGQLIIGACGAAGLALVYALAPVPEARERYRIRTLTLCAMMIAIAFVLNNYAVIYSMPTGGSVTMMAMLFLFLPGYLFGARVGVLIGVAYGLLDLLAKPHIYFPVQVLLDYPVAFGMIGLGAVLRDRKLGLHLGYVLGVCGRLCASVVSGAVFFAEYAPEGMNPWSYSFVYNISYLGPEMAMTLVLLAIPAVSSALKQAAKRYGFRFQEPVQEKRA